MPTTHLELDLSGARRVLVAGDVHGHLGRLVDALTEVCYDAEAGDRLIILGDLLDRGPDVLEIDEWLQANPSVVHLIGNHEAMLLSALGLMPSTSHNNAHTLFLNGGRWLSRFAVDADCDPTDLMVALIDDNQSEIHKQATDRLDPRVIAFAKRIAQAPIAITAVTPKGRRIGLIHADVPEPTWAETIAWLQSPDEAEAELAYLACTWERRLINRVQRAAAIAGPAALQDLEIGIPDVDHVFLGHSIVDEPMTAANLTWIDTGPHRSNAITVLDVDEWLGRSR